MADELSKRKKPSKGNSAVRGLSQEILGRVPVFDGLKTKVDSRKSRKAAGQKQILTLEVTDAVALEKDLELKKKLADVFSPSSLESYLASSDPSDALRKARMLYIELLRQVAAQTGEDSSKMSADNVRAFVEGLQLTPSERVERAKGLFLVSILTHAKLPLDPRQEMKLMIDALEQVQKALPKRKPGRKEDQSLTRAWRRIEFDKIGHKETYQLYMIENGIEAFYQNDFKAFQEKIRKKRSEEKKKQAKRTVAAKSKERRQNSGS